MEKKVLNVTVSGDSLSGKSSLTFLLKKFLKENGFDVEHKVTSDYENENEFELQMRRNEEALTKFLKENVKIKISERSEIAVLK